MAIIYKVYRVLFVGLICMMSGALYGQKNVKAVDLGLSVKWANMNVGADSPEDYGDYFAWGEVAPKRYYGQYSAYKHYDDICFRKYNYVPFRGSVNDSLYSLQLVDDVAAKRMGKGWRMPTQDEMNELLDTAKCVITPGKLNGTRGLWVTKRLTTADSIKMNIQSQTGIDSNKANGGSSQSRRDLVRQNSAKVKLDSLFLPMAGYKAYGAYRYYPGTKSYYWTSTLSTPSDTLPKAVRDSLSEGTVRNANCLVYSGADVPKVEAQDRRIGCVIRAVRDR